MTKNSICFYPAKGLYDFSMATVGGRREGRVHQGLSPKSVLEEFNVEKGGGPILKKEVLPSDVKVEGEEKKCLGIPFLNGWKWSNQRTTQCDWYNRESSTKKDSATSGLRFCTGGRKKDDSMKSKNGTAGEPAFIEKNPLPEEIPLKGDIRS